MTAAKQIFTEQEATNISPARRHFAITPSDTEELAKVTKSIYIGTVPSSGAALVVLGAEDLTPVTYLGLQAGQQLIGAFKKVLATGTTVSALIGEV